ncbi:MAG: hypothetical protein ACI4SF_16430 [Oscillospiraceae bacterium]
MSKPFDDAFTRYVCNYFWEQITMLSNSVSSDSIPEDVRSLLAELQELLLKHIGSGYTVKFSCDSGFDIIPLS